NDITVCKRAEETLRASHQIIEGIINAIPARVFWKDRNLVYLGCNAIFARDAGFVDPKDIVGKDDYQMGWRDQAELYRADDHQVIESGRPKLLIEEPQTTPEGNTIVLLTSKIPLRSSEGEIIGVLGTYMDISERKLAEEALRDSESKLAAIIEFLPDATFVIDNKKTVIAWNRAMEEMTGVNKDDMIGQGDHAYTVPFYGERRRHLLDLIDIDDKDLASKYQYVQRKGNTLYSETYTPALNGGKGAYVWATGAPLFDSEGNRIGAIESIRDITEHKRAERTLREQLNFLQQLIDSIPSPIFYKDIRGVYLGCNMAFETLTGFAKDKIVGHTVYELYPKDLADIYYEADNKLFWNPGAQVYEAAIAHADGSRRDIMVSKATYFDTEGRLAGLVGVILDITERKHMENALRESERRLGDIINFLPDATLVVDRDGKVIAWNRAIEAMTGIKAEEILGKGNYEYAIPFYGERRPILIDLVLKPQEEIEKGYDHLRRQDGTLVGGAYMPTLKGGGIFLVGSAAALYDSEGNISGAIESIRDVTENKHAEEELCRAKEEAESAMRAKSEFLANMSQEIRTPMNAVIGMTGLLQSSDLNPDQRECVEIIHSSGETLLAIINDILDYSKIEEGKGELESQPFNLRECIESSMDLVATSAAEKGLRLTYAVDDKVPENLMGDVTRLRQILVNLLSNAVKFTEAGQVSVTVTSQQKGGRYEVCFTVRDTGIGIPPGKMNRLFHSFS
ncbi:MAG TPA: PAS domain S-box protein, partial [Methanotrichaceae archaeon]|nr:PAS domain S-box protein [Methanotrichaceae archaeon]